MDNQTGESAQANQTSREPQQQAPKGSKALAWAEYGMLGTSAVGTVAAFVTKQAAYAAAPLSVSLFLNLLNRQQLTRRLEYQAQQAGQQTQTLNAKLEGELTPVKSELDELAGRVAQQEQIERDRPDLATDIAQDVASQIQQAQQATTAQIQDVQSSLTGLATSELLAQLKADFTAQSQKTEQVADGLQDIKADLTEQTQKAGQVAEGLESVKADLQSYIQDHEKTHQALDTQRQTEAEQLNQRLAWFEDQLKQVRPPAPPTLLPPEVVAKPSAPAPAPAPARPEPTPPPEPIAPTAEVATLFLNLGIDFGTRFTKVCFQNLSDGQSEIIPFRSEMPSLADALLLSQIGVLPDGQLLAGLSQAQWQELQLPGLKMLDGLKMRLADLDLGNTQPGWRLEAFPELDEPEMVENLCAYYLSRVMQKAQAWVREQRPQLVAEQIIEWSANVGVPVAYCDEQSVGDRFKRVLTLAWLLSNQPQIQVLTIQLLQEQMNGLRSQLKQAVNCHAVPEIGAESWSFLNSREAQEGYYLFFDIGDGTIDGCAFNYERADGEPQVEFYHGQVQPLGVRAIAQAVSTELNLSVGEVIAQFENQSQDDGLARSEERQRIVTMISQVVMRGGKAYAAHHPSEKDDAYQEKLTVFLGGGGSQLPFFQQLPAQTYQERSHRNYGILGYEVKLLPAPPQLQLNGLDPQDFHRFAVAFGLATDYANLSPSLHLPTQVAENVPEVYAAHSIGDDVTAYEDSRDAY